MMRYIVTGAALCVACSAAALAADGTFEKRLPVHGPVLLSVETGSGYIHVQPGPATEVHVVAHVHAGNNWYGGGSADDRVKQVLANPPVTQAGNIISIGKGLAVHNVSIDYEITTPRGTDLRADTGSGDIRIVDEGGPVKAQTGSGSIDATGLSDRVNLESGSGSIHAGMLSSLEVKAQTGSGNIELQNVQGSLWANTGSGNIVASGHPSAGWKLETGSGNVELSVGGAPYTIDAEAGSGNIETGSPVVSEDTSDKHHVQGKVNGGGPRVRVETGSGDIRVH